jgi:hypothetical protein
MSSSSYGVRLTPNSFPPLPPQSLFASKPALLAARRLPAPPPRILRQALAAAPRRGRRACQRGFPPQRRARRQRIPSPRRWWPSAALQPTAAALQPTTAALQPRASASPAALRLRLRVWIRIRPATAPGSGLRGCTLQLRPPTAAAATAGPSVRLWCSESIRPWVPTAAAADARPSASGCRVPPCCPAVEPQTGRVPPTVAVCKAAAATPSW